MNICPLSSHLLPTAPQNNVQTAELGLDIPRKSHNAKLVRAVRARHFRYERLSKAAFTFSTERYMTYDP